MKYEIKNLDKSKRLITLTCKGDAWVKAIKDSYNKTKGEYKVQGFRAGHVPQAVIEKNYGKIVFWDEAINMLINACYREILESDKTFDPISQPVVEVTEMDEGGVTVTIEVVCMPEFKLGNYKGITVKRVKANVSEKEIDDEIERGRNHNATSKEVKRESKMGDIVTIDFEGYINNVKFDGGTASDHKLELGSGNFVPGFEEQLVGKKAGADVTVNVTFPKDYGAEALAGKDAMFKCKVKLVSEKVLPAKDAEYAKKMGEFKSFDEYREDVRAQLVKVSGDDAKAKTDNALIDSIVKATEIELPEALISDQQDAIMKDLEYKLQYQGLDLEGYAKYMNTTVEDMRAGKKEEAKAIAKTKLVLEAIVKAEALRVSEEDMNAKLSDYAKMSNKTLEEYKKIIKPRQLDYLANDILMNKLINKLYELNKVVD
ncbi:MAG: trigger factor [Firmicutes bacterium]|nr:trigger factor [Bacillota bacterium]